MMIFLALPNYPGFEKMKIVAPRFGNGVAGSFHAFVMGQFIGEHFEKDPKTWSMIRICENARGMKVKGKKADYSKYIKH